MTIQRFLYIGMAVLLALQPGMQTLSHGLLMMAVAGYLGWTFTDVW